MAILPGVTVLDVHDRSALTLVQQTTLEGNYVESRAVGDFVYVATEKNGVAPRPAVVEIVDEGDPDNPDDDSVTRRYETAEEYFARMDGNPAELLDAALPNYASAGADEVVPCRMAQLARGYLSADERRFVRIDIADFY
ncbi:MAG: beta-propeller domain-containing protein [Pirellulaceae bacterium]